MQNQDRFKSILTIVTGLLAISWIFDIPSMVYISLLIGAISIFFPFAAKWIEWFWMKLAMALGWVNSRILLSVIYFAFLFPIAWLSRLFTKDPLQLKQSKSKSLYSIREHLYKKEDLENIW